ncbi:uncharacterized protein C8A04DRAFT_14135 [Dichotomopilus funicola]|uniref:GmrSD restriction endonucleases C-terminal domain-containing protein n=1 Tax=Dichotomopilus funicola TaxID=1934379 RepID=A0AAN6UYT7_9PEZI|nr:hypothetical protein C8A04DRAFT_14135 [Dichotomopilus funicola]
MKSFILGSLLAVAVSAIPMPAPTPPGIPSASTAKSQLASLTVKAAVDDGSYSRDLFPTWETKEGTCNTREYVLKRDGTNVQVNDACTATSGSWFSPYDGATWTAASDVDIDHMVPLKNAWISGANAWTTARRQQFANDIDHPQLWAVTDNVNQAKSDKSPDQWKPPLASFYCTYARAWVSVKSTYDLTITSAEKSALSSMLNTC